MRVLFVNHTSIYGGAEANLLNLIRFSNYGSYTPVGVLLPEPGPFQDYLGATNLPVGVVPFYGFRLLTPYRIAQTLAILVKWVRNVEPDIIHLNHQWLVQHIVVVGKLTGKPVICHIRNLMDESFANKQRYWLNKCDALIAVSDTVRRRAIQLGISADKMNLIFDGVELSRFGGEPPKSSIRILLDIPKSDKLVGFCGRVAPEKGPQDLLNASKSILQCCPDTHFVFVGGDDSDGRYIEHLKTIAKNVGTSGRVHFMGFRKDVEKILPEFDVLVHPSRREMAEGLPLTILEAISSGCIIVATPNSGTVEIIMEQETGILVESNNPEAIADGVMQALTLPCDERTMFITTGREIVRSRHSSKVQAREVGRLYRGLKKNILANASD